MLRSSALQTEKLGDYTVTVEQIQFRGSDTQVIFRGTDGTIWRKNYPQTPEFQVGQQLSVTLGREQGILFPKA